MREYASVTTSNYFCCSKPCYSLTNIFNILTCASNNNITGIYFY
mgnify:CR=1 FL=1